MASTIEPPLPADLQPKNKEYVIFTTLSSNGPIFRDDRPALVVSSTSWTADEDFSILLTALDAYQAAKSRGRALPRLLVLITGRGELRAPFEVAVARREAAGAWPDVSARCLFLPAADYPVLLGCADLGISMHQSSSGRDLPMKVADMFGCGMPVLARGFACLDELVRDGENGRVFGDAEELAAQLEDTLEGFPRAPRLEALKAFFDPSKRKSAKDGDGEEWSNWDENWDTVMKDGILDFA